MDALTLIEEHLKGQPGKPPLHLWEPALSGDIDIVIRSNGDWVHEGSKIQRPALVKLFASILRREQDGHYYLVTPVEKWRLQVEQAPLLVVAMDVLKQGSDQQQIVLTTNVDDKVLLSADYPLTVTVDEDSGAPLPTVVLDNKLFARVDRPVFYHLVECGVERDDALAVLSDGCWFELGSL